MTITSENLDSAADLCSNAADAALTKLIELGARPADANAAATWDAQDSLLKNKISTLNNLSSSISAQIVSNALDQQWPNLNTLSAVTASAQVDIQKIADINQAMATLASIINFGVSVITMATQPSVANSESLATSFKNMAGILQN